MAAVQKVVEAASVEVATGEEEQQEVHGIQSTLDESVYLPPIHRLKIPDTKTQSAKIRWLHAIGYPTKEIARGLGVRYQQARNIITTQPKRAAREDLPPLEVEVLEVEDIVDTLLGSELDRTFQEERKATSRKGKRATPLEDGEPSDEELFGDGEYNEGDNHDA